MLRKAGGRPVGGASWCQHGMCGRCLVARGNPYNRSARIRYPRDNRLYRRQPFDGPDSRFRLPPGRFLAAPHVYEAMRVFEHISAHMPFTEVHLLSSDAEVRRAGIDQIRRAMDSLAFLEGSVAVVHAGWPEEGKTFRDVWPLMLETFRSLGDYAGERGLKIGLETMQPDSVEKSTAPPGCHWHICARSLRARCRCRHENPCSLECKQN